MLTHAPNTDNLLIGAAAKNSAKLDIDGDADEVQLSIQAHSTQSSNIITVEKSTGTDVFTVSGEGAIETQDLTSVAGGNFIKLPANENGNACSGVANTLELWDADSTSADNWCVYDGTSKKFCFPATTTTATQVLHGSATAGEMAFSAIVKADLPASAYTDVKCMTLEDPANADDWLMFKAPANLTVTQINCVAAGATGTVVVAEADANGGSSSNLDGATTITCGNGSNTNDDGTLSNPSVDSGDWVRVDPTSVTSSCTQIGVCMKFTYVQ